MKFIHVVRDGRDIAFSGNQSPVNKFYRNSYRDGPEKFSKWEGRLDKVGRPGTSEASGGAERRGERRRAMRTRPIVSGAYERLGTCCERL